MLLDLVLSGLSSLLSIPGALRVQSPGAHRQSPHAVDFRQRNFDTIESIYNLTVFPNNLPFLTNGTLPADLFNADASGRIAPLGNYTGEQESAEYFFGLSPVPTPYNNYMAFDQVEIVSFTSECPEVATSVVYFNSSTTITDPRTGDVTRKHFATLKQIAMWRFDADGAVLQYEAWVPNLQAYLNPTTPGFEAGMIQFLCPLIQDQCVGANQQYDSVAECVQVFTEKSFGHYDEVWGDNVVCRQIHSILTRLRPEVHCPHVGKIGGNMEHGFKCTNIDYNVDYFDDHGLYGHDGHPFFCQAKNQYHHIKRDVEGPGASV